MIQKQKQFQIKHLWVFAFTYNLFGYWKKKKNYKNWQILIHFCMSNPVQTVSVKQSSSNRCFKHKRNQCYSHQQKRIMMLLCSRFNLCCTQKEATERISKHTFLFFSFHIAKWKGRVHMLLPMPQKVLHVGCCSELPAYREALEKILTDSCKKN